MFSQGSMSQMLTRIVKNNQLELEVRYGYFYGRNSNFSSNVPLSHYHNLIKSLNTQENIVKHVKNVIVTNYEYNNNNIRSIQEAKPLRWESKIKEHSDVLPYDIRISFATEIPVQPIPVDQRIATNTRSKNTTIYTIGSSRIEMSIVTTSNQIVSRSTTYEVECEFILPPPSGPINNEVALTDYLTTCQNVWLWLRDSIEIYTVQEKNDLSRRINDLLNTIPESVSRINNELTLLLKQRITPKLRELIVEHLSKNDIRTSNGDMTNLYNSIVKLNLPDDIMKIINSIDISYKDHNRLDTKFISTGTNLGRRTLVDGPLANGGHISMKIDGSRMLIISDKNNLWSFYPPNIFSLLSRSSFVDDGTILDTEMVIKDGKYIFLVFDTLIMNGIDVRKKNYSDRLFNINYSNDFITIENKIVLPFTNYNDLNKNIDTITLLSSIYDQDGFLFTTNGEYMNKFYKLKSSITIDLIVKGNDLLMYDTDTMSNVLFNYENDDLTVITTIIVPKVTAPNETVIEFLIEKEINKKNIVLTLKELRHRPDKSGSNTKNVIYKNISSAIDGMTLNDIKGKSIGIVRGYNNSIKKSLYDKIPRGSQILDIGSGWGGDVSKWKAQNLNVVAVEPDANKIPVLLARLKEENYEKNVQVIQAKGENDLGLGEQRFNYITFMLSLSFFYQNKHTFQGLVHNINKYLNDDGKILFLTIDGDCINQLFRPVLAPQLKLPQNISLAGTQLNLIDNTLHVVIPGIVGEQDEWLVYPHELGIVEDYNKANKCKFLGNETFIYSSLFSFGIIRKRMNKATARATSLGRELIHLPADIGRDDSTTPLKCSWFSDLHRIACIGDGSCLVHAIAKGVSENYRQTKTETDRRARALKIRKDAADLLDKPHKLYRENNTNSIIRNYSLYEVAGRGTLMDAVANQILSILDNGTIISIDYSCMGIKAMLNNPNAYLGDEMYGIFAEILSSEIFIFRAYENDIGLHSYIKPVGKSKGAVVIIANDIGNHYELVGWYNGKFCETFFSNDHPFYKALIEWMIYKALIDRTDKDNLEQFNPRDNFLTIINRNFINENGQITPFHQISTVLNNRSDEPFIIRYSQFTHTQ